MIRRLLVAAALLFATAHLSAQCTSEPLAALAPGTGAGWQFGTAVALQGDELLVSEPGWPYGNKLFGRVRVFRFVGGQWIYATTVEPPDGPRGLGFGTALVLKRNQLFVGAQAAFKGDVLCGAVYVYEKVAGEWTFRQKLTPALPEFSQFFGASLAVDGDRMVVGGWGDSPPFSSGAAWIFERRGDTWEEVIKLKPADVGFAENFGTSVALAGDWVAVGRPGDNSSFGPGGRVHVFHREPGGAWLQTQVLESTAVFGGDYLGFRLAMQGNTLLASAHLEWLGGSTFFYGAVYAFERDGGTWKLAQKIVAGDPDDTDAFGASLALQGERLAVGSGVMSSLSSGAGAVQLFERHSGVWVRVGAVDAPAALTEPSAFGCSVALDDTRLAAGCDRDNAQGLDAGQAFAFDIGDPQLPVGVGVAGAGGFVPELLGATCGTAGAQDLTITVQHGLGGAAGALLAGATIDAQPFKGGVTYPSEPWRLHPHVLGGAPGAAGAGSWEIAGAVPAGMSGIEFVVQVIYADPAAFGGWSTSGALVIELD